MTDKRRTPPPRNPQDPPPEPVAPAVVSPVVTRNQILVTAIMAAVTGVTMWLVSKGIGAIETSVARRRAGDLEKASPPQPAPQTFAGLQPNGSYELPRPSHAYGSAPRSAPQHNVRASPPPYAAPSAPSANAGQYRTPSDWSSEAAHLRQEMSDLRAQIDGMHQSRPPGNYEEVG